MDKIRYIIFLLGASLLSVFLVNGQVSFVAKAPSQVSVGQQFALTYEVNQNGQDLKIPELPNFEFLHGPSTSQSSEYSIVNGNVTQSMRFGYTFYYKATKDGTFKIPPATILINGEKLSSNSLQINVLKKQAQPKNTNQQSSSNFSEIKGEDLFLKTYVSKRSAFVGEQITATVKLFSKYQINGNENLSLPNYSGFYKQEIENEATLKREQINGETYLTAVIQKTILFPQRSGDLEIEPATIDLILAIRDQRRRRSIMDEFFGGGYKNVRKKIASKPVKIEVRSLPKGAPSTFNGAVGSFKLNASLDKSEVKANDAVTLKIKVSGNGNIKLFEAPNIQFPPDFEVYEPKVTQNIKNTTGGQSGHKTFEYLVIPRHAGSYKIDPIVMHYFDPKTKSYKSLSTQKYLINVDRGDESDPVQVMTGISNKEDIKYLGQDIRYIKTEGNLAQEKNPFFGSPGYIFSIFFILLGGGIYVLVHRKQKSRSTDVKYVRNKRASKEAIRKLNSAKNHLNNQETQQFYEALSKGMWGYVADKFNISGSDLSKDVVQDNLINAGVSEDVCKEYWALIDHSDMARYSNTEHEQNQQALYEEALSILSKIEQNIS